MQARAVGKPKGTCGVVSNCVAKILSSDIAGNVVKCGCAIAFLRTFFPSIQDANDRK